MERKLAGYGMCADGDSARFPIEPRQLRFSVERERTPRELVRKALQGAKEDVAFGKTAPHRLGRIEDDGLGFTQREQAEAMIEIPVGEHDRRHGRISNRAWVERGEALDLLSYIGRGIEEKPV